MRQGKIFVLFMVYAMLQTAGVLVMTQFVFPPFSPILVPLMNRIFGDFALHYPNNFMVLPVMFFWFNLILSGLLGILLVGLSTHLFWASFQRKAIQVRTGLRHVAPKLLTLFVAWVVETMVLVLIFVYLPKLLTKMDFIDPNSNLSKQLITSFVAIVAAAFFTYTTVLIVLHDEGPLPAIRKSVAMFFRFPVITLLLVALPNLMKMPMDLISGRPLFLITKFSPEMVAAATILSILVSMFANYFLVGTVTSYYGSVQEKIPV